jgi:hypothetical protein
MAARGEGSPKGWQEWVRVDPKSTARYTLVGQDPFDVLVLDKNQFGVLFKNARLRDIIHESKATGKKSFPLRLYDVELREKESGPEFLSLCSCSSLPADAAMGSGRLVDVTVRDNCVIAPVVLFPGQTPPPKPPPGGPKR